MDFANNESVQDFYNSRHNLSYLDKWPEWKMERVCEIISSLDLPEVGEALDFGCGSGAFASLLKRALPKWAIHGCDVSNIAIEKAQDKYKDVTFFVYKGTLPSFDFIFTHHVLEHIELKTAKQFKSKYMLHILPCGNVGSWDTHICNLHKHGWKENGCVYFEEKEHLRRFTTEGVCSWFCDYYLEKEWYANQYFGAIELLFECHPKIIIQIYNPLNGKDLKSKLELTYHLLRFLFLFSLIIPNILSTPILKHFSKYVRRYFRRNAEKEWQRNNKNINGSEMYLYFKLRNSNL